MRDQAWELQFETASRMEARAIVFRKSCKTQRSETAFEIKSRLSDLKTAKSQKTDNREKFSCFTIHRKIRLFSASAPEAFV